MGELRKDYILNRWVIIATERAKRPHEFAREVEKTKIKECYFCPGHENETPPEISRVEQEVKRGKNKVKEWKIRVFPNKFAAVRQEGEFNIRTDNQFYTFSANYGRHEVVVETPDHQEQLWDLSEKDIQDVLKVYCQRINALYRTEGISYVCVFKNSGKDAGTSIVHTHSQIIAYNKVPEFVQEEIDASKNYPICPYCSIISNEKNSFRRCFENSSFVAFTPYASRFPMEIWIFSKEHRKSVTDLNEAEIKDLSEVMASVLRKLKKLNAPFNYVLHNAPPGQDLHFHIEVLPRLATWAGFEFNGTIINTMAPEEAAKFYRGEK